MDFIIIGAVIVFALIGFLKGSAKMCLGLLMLLIIMVGSAFISAAVCPLFLKSEKDGEVTYTGAATFFMDKYEGIFPTDGEFGELLDAEITKDEEGTLYVNGVALKEEITEKVPYVGSFAASLSESEAREGITLRKTFAFKLTEYTYETIVWLVLVITLAIIRNILRKKLYVYLDSHPGPSKVDRVVGLVFGLVIMLAILWGVGTLIAHFDDGGNWANSADAFLIKGVLAEPLMTNNPVLKLIGVTLPVS